MLVDYLNERLLSILSFAFVYELIDYYIHYFPSLGVVDAAVMGGTANYEEAFCNPLFLEMHPEKAKLVDKLQVS